MSQTVQSASFHTISLSYPLDIILCRLHVSPLTPYVHCISLLSIRAVRPVHFVFLDLITQKRILRSKNQEAPHFAVFCSLRLLAPFSTIFPNTFSHTPAVLYRCNYHNPLTTRPRGRPKYRWENIIQDVGQMKIKNSLTCVQDRAKWKDVVEEAKTSN
jgi:hypothetical protein